MAQQHQDELAAKQQGAPHGTHIRPMVQQAAQTQPPGPELHSQMQGANPGHTGNSSFVSIEEHSEFTMAALMKRDALHPVDPDEDIVSIRDSSDIEMVPTHEYDLETKNSSPDSSAENSHHPSDSSNMEFNQDRGSGHHSDLDSDQGSDLGSALGSDAGSDSDNGGDPESSDNGGDFSDMFIVKKECPSSSKRPQSRPSSNSRSRSWETENQKRRHVPSPENASNSGKPDPKKKKSDWKETPSKTTPKKESAQDEVTRRVREEVVQKFWEEEENRERESRPKKSKKKESSLRKETLAGQDSSKEDERRNWKKKDKDTKAWEAREAECRAEKRRKEKAEDMWLAQEKLINKERREKYSVECPELVQYWKDNISEWQRGSVNLDDHTTYLWEAQKDKSLYPHKNIMSGHQLIVLLEKYGLKKKADKVRAVIKKGLNTYAPSRMLAAGDPVIEPKYFIRVIQKSSSEIMDWRGGEFGDDQNIGLHDLVSQMSMCRVTTTQNVSVSGRTYSVQIDSGFCPFCQYHAECHKTLNNHVQLHLHMLMFCGVPGCFYTTFNSKFMIPHAAEVHKISTWNQSLPGKLFPVTRVSNFGLTLSPFPPASQSGIFFPESSTEDQTTSPKSGYSSILNGLQSSCTRW